VVDSASVPRKPRLPPIPEQDVRTFERKIDFLCRKHGLTPGKLGEFVGLRFETLPKLLARARENHKVEFPGSAETYKEIAEKCDVSVEWLLGMTDDPTPPPRKP